MDDGTFYLSSYYYHWFWGRWGKVTHYTTDGTVIGDITTGALPAGITMDRDGKIWVIGTDDEYIHRIDPAIDAVDLSKRIVGGQHSTASTMNRNTSNYYKDGTWTIIHDTNQLNTPWGLISWTGTEPTGTTINVMVRSSNDQTSWSAWEDATNNALLHLTPPGRYLQVMVTLTSTVKDVSPVLYDLTVTPLAEAPVNKADLGLTILTPTIEPTVNGTIKIVLHAGNNGPNDATGVQVNYRLPFGLQYQSTNGPYNPTTGIWTIGNIASGTTSTLEIIARILNSGSLVNTGTITGTEYDPQTTNNHATLTLNIPNPATEEELPEVPANLPSAGEATLPPIANIGEGMNLDPGVPLVSNTGSGNTGGSNGPGSGPSTVGGNDQLYRDQMYVRDYVGSPLTDPRINNPNGNDDTNKTTPKPEMPGWEIDWGIMEDIALAITLIAGSIIFAILSQREGLLPKYGQYEEQIFGTWIYSDMVDAVLLALSIVAFITCPEAVSAILLFFASLAPFVKLIYEANKTGFMIIFTLVLLFISFYFIIKKIQEGRLKYSMLFDLLNELGNKFGKK